MTARILATLLAVTAALAAPGDTGTPVLDPVSEPTGPIPVRLRLELTKVTEDGKAVDQRIVIAEMFAVTLKLEGDSGYPCVLGFAADYVYNANALRFEGVCPGDHPQGFEGDAYGRGFGQSPLAKLGPFNHELFYDPGNERMLGRITIQVTRDDCDRGCYGTCDGAQLWFTPLRLGETSFGPDATQLGRIRVLRDGGGYSHDVEASGIKLEVVPG